MATGRPHLRWGLRMRRIVLATVITVITTHALVYGTPTTAPGGHSALSVF